MNMRRLLRPRLTRVSSAGFSLAASIAFSIFATECLIAMMTPSVGKGAISSSARLRHLSPAPHEVTLTLSLSDKFICLRFIIKRKLRDQTDGFRSNA